MKNPIYILLIASINTAVSQVTFNKRFHFDYLAAVLTNVIPTDSCYYGLGIIADTIAPYNTGNFFAKFDLDGELVNIKTLTSGERTYETWQNSLHFLNDTSLVVAGETVDSVGSTLLVAYNLLGDTFFTKKIPNPTAPEFTFIQPRGGLGLTADGGVIVSNWYTDHVLGDHSSADIYIFKVNSSGDIEWESFFHSPNTDRASSILVEESGNIVLGWLTANFNLVFEDFTSQVKLARLDSQGGTIWEYTTPEFIGLRDAPNDMVQLDDGSFIIASGVGTEIEWPTGNTIWYEKMLFKLSAQGVIMWETVIPDFELDGNSRATNVIQISDGSGFIVGGEHGEDIGSPNDYSYAIRGDISKISNEGQLLWTRRYIGIETDNPRHEVIDLKECLGGGFILAGESLDGDLVTSPPQQAWLLKLDQYGCLVPGCHLIDDIGEEVGNPLQLAIYPNPTTDYLNFQLRSSSVIQNGMFRITSSDGKLVREFAVDVRQEDTFVVPVWDWAAGVYFLQYLNGEGRVILSERFVKN